MHTVSITEEAMCTPDNLRKANSSKLEYKFNTLWSHRFICQSLYLRYAVCIGISIRWRHNISITWVTFTSNIQMTSFWAHDTTSISIPLLPPHCLTGLGLLALLYCVPHYTDLSVQTTDKSIKCLLVLRSINLWHVSLWPHLPKVHEACITPCQML